MKLTFQQYKLFKSLRFQIPSDTLQTYQIIWAAQPHIDENFLQEIKKKIEIDSSILIK